MAITAMLLEIYRQELRLMHKPVASSPPGDDQTPNKLPRRNTKDTEQPTDLESTPPLGRSRLRYDEGQLPMSPNQGPEAPLELSLQLSENHDIDGDQEDEENEEENLIFDIIQYNEDDESHGHGDYNALNEEGEDGEVGEDRATISLERIHEAIEYTRSQISQGLPLMQTTRFEVRIETATYKPSDVEVYVFELLDDSPATVAFMHPDYIVYELGIPLQDFVTAAVGVVVRHTPQWWVGKSAAHIRAGPWADSVDLRKAEAKAKEMETKKMKQKPGYKTLRQEETESKLEEGLRRQHAGLAMCSDEEEDEKETGSESEEKESSDMEDDDVEMRGNESDSSDHEEPKPRKRLRRGGQSVHMPDFEPYLVDAE